MRRSRPFHVLLLLLIEALAALGDPVLRYRMSSCNTLEPTYVDENWQKPGGSDSEMDEEEVGLFDTPQKSRERNPPFSIEIDFTQYRRGRDYTVSILTENYFDAFIMQARGQERPDGNATLVGEWVKMPGITKHLKCIGTMRSTVTDKGRPVLLGNMSFTWRAPTIDFGPITFVLSVVKGNRYTEVSSPSISFNTFPVSIRGCGRQLSCFRRCTTQPTCPADQSDFMVVIDLTRDEQEVVISMGGRVEEVKSLAVTNGHHDRKEDMDMKDDNNQETSDKMSANLEIKKEMYVAVGFGRDKRNLQGMDVSACYKEGDEVRLGHYHVEDAKFPPYPHRAELSLDRWDLDTMQDGGTFLWCTFRRPVRPDPDSIWELDLSLQLFQFFFTGMKNQSRIYLPDKGDIFSTGMRRNFSKITNDISFIGGSRATQSPRSKSTASAHFVVVFMVFLGTILVIF